MIRRALAVNEIAASIRMIPDARFRLSKNLREVSEGPQAL